MTPLDRLIESCPDDGPQSREAQVALVQALMARTRLCPTCITELDADLFCPLCGFQENNQAQPQSFGGRGAALKEEV